MSNDILQQVEKDFSERMQWYSFLELINYKDFIQNSWFDVLKAELNTCFASKENIVDKWGYVSINKSDYRWFITEFGHESLCLSFDGLSLHLWANGGYFDLANITSLLQTEKFWPIYLAFDRRDDIKGADSSSKIIETGNFAFDETDSNDRKYNREQIAWYAKYRTKEFVEQIKNKIDKFRRDNTITELLIEINTTCKYSA